MPKCNKMYNYLDFYNPDGSVTPCCYFDKEKTSFGWNSYIPKIKYFEWYDMRERMKEGKKGRNKGRKKDRQKERRI